MRRGLEGLIRVSVPSVLILFFGSKSWAKGEGTVKDLPVLADNRIARSILAGSVANDRVGSMMQRKTLVLQRTSLSTQFISCLQLQVAFDNDSWTISILKYNPDNAQQECNYSPESVSRLVLQSRHYQYAV